MGDKMISFDKFVGKRYKKEYFRKEKYRENKGEEKECYKELTENEKSKEKAHIIKRLEFRVNDIIFAGKPVVLRRFRMHKYSQYNREEDEKFLDKRLGEQQIAYEKIKAKLTQMIKRREKLINGWGKYKPDERARKIETTERIIKGCYKSLKEISSPDWIDRDGERYKFLTKKERVFYDFILDEIVNENENKEKANCRSLIKGDWDVMDIEVRCKMLGMIDDLIEEGWMDISDEQIEEIMSDVKMKILVPDVWRVRHIQREFLFYSEMLDEILEKGTITDEIKKAIGYIEKGGKLLEKIYEEKYNLEQEELTIQDILQQMI